ncbi:aspartate/glutamate racemase family protein [Vibrio fluvialis]
MWQILGRGNPCHSLGGLNSAQICLYSVNFEPIEKLQHEGKWDETAQLLAQAAKSVEAGGADFLLICTNTMHKVAPEIEAQISIPILHIADATAKQLQQDGIERVGLLGTRFTMEQEFYKGRLQQQFGIDVLIPDAEQRQQVHRVIYEELCMGTIRPESRAQYVEIVEDLHRRGAQAVILGCTEIALLIQQHDTDVPLYDTTKIHAEQAVQLALT